MCKEHSEPELTAKNEYCWKRKKKKSHGLHILENFFFCGAHDYCAPDSNSRVVLCEIFSFLTPLNFGTLSSYDFPNRYYLPLFRSQVSRHLLFILLFFYLTSGLE